MMKHLRVFSLGSIDGVTQSHPVNIVFILLATFLFSCNSENLTNADPADWSGYQGGPDVNQYSALDQITTDNVDQLEVTWIYESNDADPQNRTQIQCNPLVIDGILYGTTPTLKAVALNAATGEEIWRFDPFGGDYDMFGMGVNRGLAQWTDGEERRILYAVADRLYALDAATGEPISSFGKEGMIDLHEGLGRDVSDYFIAANAPGIVYQDKFILGMRVSESTGAAPGHIRAYNVLTGEQEWIFHTIPQPGQYGYDTWPEDAWKRAGGANAWAGLSLDPERGIVFIPTGSAAYDFYGGDRHGENLFANSLIALDANTGERIWHYQMVHHDLWDRDLPAPANLVTVTHNGEKIEAVAQITKSAFVFLFDRETGEPLFPIEEVPAPSSDLEGEAAWPTQPMPTKPERFARHRFAEEDITRRTPEAYEYVKSIWANTAKGDLFIPPTEQGTILFPGFDGGGEWGGAAADPNGILYVNAGEMAWILQMLPYEQEPEQTLAARGRNIYNSSCMICHGKDLKGASIHTVPSLVDLKERKTAAEVAEVVRQGQGMMPSFSHLSEPDVEAVTAFLLEEGDEALPKEVGGDQDDPWPYPYVMNGYQRFKDQDGFPATTPPWGTLNAIDLNTGEIKWKVTLGEHPDLEGAYDQPTGCENYGGPVVTAGNVLFIAATMDEKIRAFDRRDGSLLWEATLPAAGYATPAVYAVDGKQYVVIACGGGKLGTKSGDAYVAFALPE